MAQPEEAGKSEKGSEEGEEEDQEDVGEAKKESR